MSEQWTPFERAHSIRADAKMLAIAMQIDLPQDEIWINNRYQVHVLRTPPPSPDWPGIIHLSIKRRDKQAIHDWRDMQRIKNEIVGPEHEGVELYPAESRLTDSANQFHIWCLSEPGQRFPFGFGERFVSNTSEMGAVQRPFPADATPHDCKTMAQYCAEHQIQIP